MHRPHMHPRHTVPSQAPLRQHSVVLPRSPAPPALTPAVPHVEGNHVLVLLVEPQLLNHAKPLGPVQAVAPQRVHLAAGGGQKERMEEWGGVGWVLAWQESWRRRRQAACNLLHPSAANTCNPFSTSHSWPPRQHYCSA